jgi:hypothetical protein
MSNPTQQSVLNIPSKDKFLLVLNLPSVLKEQFKTDSRFSIEPLEIKVFGSVVPEIAVPSTVLPYAGQNYNVSTHVRPNYSPLAVNFFVDNEFINYYTMWSWLNVLNTFDQSIYGGSRFDTIDRQESSNKNGLVTEYQTKMSVFALNEYNKKTVEFIYHNAFITNLGGITYNYQDPTYLQSTVTFQFSQFQMNLLDKSIETAC